jgi:hypothetical protein
MRPEPRPIRSPRTCKSHPVGHTPPLRDNPQSNREPVPELSSFRKGNRQDVQTSSDFANSRYASRGGGSARRYDFKASSTATLNVLGFQPPRLPSPQPRPAAAPPQPPPPASSPPAPAAEHHAVFVAPPLNAHRHPPGLRSQFLFNPANMRPSLTSSSHIR